MKIAATFLLYSRISYMRRVYYNSVIVFAFVIIVVFESNHTLYNYRSKNLHLQLQDHESRIAGGCRLPINLVDQFILEKIPGISSARAALIYEALQKKEAHKLNNSEDLRKYLQSLKGIGPKTAQQLVQHLSHSVSFELCNVWIT